MRFGRFEQSLALLYHPHHHHRHYEHLWAYLCLSWPILMRHAGRTDGIDGGYRVTRSRYPLIPKSSAKIPVSPASLRESAEQFGTRLIFRTRRQFGRKARVYHQKEGYPPRIRNSAALLRLGSLLRVGHEQPVRKPIARLLLETLSEFSGCRFPRHSHECGSTLQAKGLCIAQLR
jgi:hypothetical protein